VVIRRQSLIFVYIGDGQWHRFDLEVLEVAALDLAAQESEALVRRARC
jgi:hypothetical protein